MLAEKIGISVEELDKLIKEKIDEYGGILLEEAALNIIAKEYGINLKEDVEDFLIKDIQEGQINVEVVGIVKDVSPLKTYKKKDGSEGHYKKVVIADKSGEITITLWDDLAKKDIKVGDILKIKRARAKKWRDNLELTSYQDTTINILDSHKKELPEIKEVYNIEELKPGMRATIIGNVISAYPLKEFKRNDKIGRFKSFILDDGTGIIRVTLWDDLALKVDVRKGDKVKVKGFIRKNYYFEDALECTAEEVEILEKGEVPESPLVKINELKNYDNEVVSVEGIIKAISGKKYRYINDEKRRFISVLLEDETGEVNINFWSSRGFLLDEVKEGDKVKIKNCKVNVYYTEDGEEIINLNATSETEIEKLGETEFNIEFYKIRDILEGDIDNINLIGKVVDIYINEVLINDDIRTVKNIIVEDDTGRIRLVVWDDREVNVKEGDTIKILNAKIRERDNYKDLVLGKYGRVDVIENGIFRKFIADLVEGENAEIRGAIVKLLSGPVVKICPNCKKRVDNYCEECGIEGKDVLTLSFILDDGTDNVICRAYDNKVEKLLKDIKENIINKSLEELNTILGEEFVLFGNYSNDTFNVRLVKNVDIKKEIKILKDLL